MKPKVLVLTGYGINCDYETEYAFNLSSVGGEARRVHINDIIEGHDSLDNYHILAFPGGFSFGDDIASGKVLAIKFEYNLRDSLDKFIDDGKLIIGICNGFQALVKLKVLPRIDSSELQDATLTFNDNCRFEDRWVYLKKNPDTVCVFTEGIEQVYFPVRHGEGKFIPRDETVKKALWDNRQVVFQYASVDGDAGCGYPENPNGSVDNIAGICDTSGRIFGLMPHPEAYLFGHNHPRWTREDLPAEGMGVQIFRNAVRFAKKNL